METDSPYSALITEFMPPFGKRPLKVTPVHRVIARRDGAELCYVQGKEFGKDPEYWYLTADGAKAVLGPTGMLKSVERLAESSLEIVVHRNNAYGNFWDKEHNQVIGRELSDAIEEVYRGIHSLEFIEDGQIDIFQWDSARLISRFEDYKQIYNGNDIIPEYSDRMTIVKLSDGCPRKCIYCPEPSPDFMVPYTDEGIKQEILKSRELQRRHHSGLEFLMDEGFLNTTDLLQFHLKGWADPIGIVDLFREHFPELRKIYSFMGVPSVNMTNPTYLTKLFNNAQGINRVLIGIESADDATSRFLGKNETYKEKLEALLKLRDAGFKVKPIVQIGMVGEGFYKNAGNFVSSRQGLEVTARLISEFLSRSVFSKKPDKVLISKYIPIEGTPLKRLHEEGKLVKPYSSPSGVEEDIRFFIGLLQRRRVDMHSQVETDYESALEGRVRDRD